MTSAARDIRKLVRYGCLIGLVVVGLIVAFGHTALQRSMDQHRSAMQLLSSIEQHLRIVDGLVTETALASQSGEPKDLAVANGLFDRLAESHERIAEAAATAGVPAALHQRLAELQVDSDRIEMRCSILLGMIPAQVGTSVTLDRVAGEHRAYRAGVESAISDIEKFAGKSMSRTRLTQAILLLLVVVLLLVEALLIAGPLATRIGDTISKLEESRVQFAKQSRRLQTDNKQLKISHAEVVKEVEDVNEANRMLATASSRFAELFEGMPVACFSVDADGTIYEWNLAATELFNVAAAEIVQKQVYGRFLGSENDVMLGKLVKEAFVGGATNNIEMTVKNAYGADRKLLLSVFPLRARQSEPTGALIACVDISKQKMAEAAAARANRNIGNILESIKDAFVALDRGLRYQFVNAAAVKLLDRPVKEVIGRRFFDVRPELEGTILETRIREVLESQQATTFDYYFAEDDVWFEFRIYHTDAGVSIFSNDVTERKLAEQMIRGQQEQIEAAMEQINEYNQLLEEQQKDLETANVHLHELATTDGLTGLINHRTLQEILRNQIQKSKKKRTGKLAIILLDVDHFKSFNDDYGHQAGDEVLRLIGKILMENVREEDVVARYGGEEFMAILPGASIEIAIERAEVLRAAIEGFGWKNRTVTASFGIAEFKRKMSPTELITHADKALYAAKRAGRNRSMVFEELADSA